MRVSRCSRECSVTPACCMTRRHIVADGGSDFVQPPHHQTGLASQCLPDGWRCFPCTPWRSPAYESYAILDSCGPCTVRLFSPRTTCTEQVQNHFSVGRYRCASQLVENLTHSCPRDNQARTSHVGHLIYDSSQVRNCSVVSFVSSRFLFPEDKTRHHIRFSTVIWTRSKPSVMLLCTRNVAGDLIIFLGQVAQLYPPLSCN
jgi:hypothetical protein